jgi:hypothetical protein
MFIGLFLRQFIFIPVFLNISNYATVFFYTMFTLCHFETKMGSIFIFGSRLYF